MIYRFVFYVRERSIRLRNRTIWQMIHIKDVLDAQKSNGLSRYVCKLALSCCEQKEIRSARLNGAESVL